jgi:tetratricopeptide (TPR) repeat protein
VTRHERRRRRANAGLALGAAAAVLAALAGLADVLGLSTGLTIALVLAPLAIGVAQWLIGHGSPLHDHARVLPAAGLDPFDDLGVRPPGRGAEVVDEFGRPAYVRRDIDAFLRTALRDGALVAVSSPRLTGSSRTLLEVLARLGEDHPLGRANLVIPNAPEDLGPVFDVAPAALTRRRLRRVPAVVWLDDLWPHLVGGALTLELIQEASRRRPRVALAGTLDPEDRARLADRPELRRALATMQALAPGAKLARVAVLEERLTDSERERARGLGYPEEIAHGIGRWCIAADVLVESYAGRPDQPVGGAVVDAALDWRIAGIEEPIPERVLSALAFAYAADAGVGVGTRERFGADDFPAALRWATRSVVPEMPLLRRVGDEGYRADPVLEPVRRRTINGRLPERFLEIVSAHGDVGPAARIALGEAMEKTGRFADAATVLEPLSRSGDAAAALALGRVRAGEGRIEDAEAELRRAEELGDERIAARARVASGVALARAGRDDGLDRLRASAARDDAEEAAAANLELGRLDVAARRPREALESLRTAADSGCAPYAPQAAAELGWTIVGKVGAGRVPRELVIEENFAALADAGHRAELREAARYLEAAAGSGDPAVAPEAALRLAKLHCLQGDDRDADAAFRRAMAFDAPSVSAHAALSLGHMHAHLKHLADAEHVFRGLRTHRERTVAAEAALQLADILTRKYEMAGEHESVAPGTPLTTRALAAEHPLFAEMEGLLNDAAAEGDPATRATAWVNLGMLLAPQPRRFKEATDALREAIATGESPAADVARLKLGELSLERERLGDAEAALTPLAESDHPLAARAALTLGHALSGTSGRERDAARLLQKAADSGDAEVAGSARRLLATVTPEPP